MEERPSRLLTGILASELENSSNSSSLGRLRGLGMTYNLFTHSQVILLPLRIFPALVPFPSKALDIYMHRSQPTSAYFQHPRSLRVPLVSVYCSSES